MAHLKNPAGHTPRLSGKKGVALDPCAAIQVSFDIAPAGTEIVFRSGTGRSMDEANRLIQRFRGSAQHTQPWKDLAVLETIRSVQCR